MMRRRLGGGTGWRQGDEGGAVELQLCTRPSTRVPMFEFFRRKRPPETPPPPEAPAPDEVAAPAEEAAPDEVAAPAEEAAPDEVSIPAGEAAPAPPSPTALPAGDDRVTPAQGFAEVALPGASEVGLSPVAVEAAAGTSAPPLVPQDGDLGEAPVDAVAAAEPARKSWRDRLKAGLGLSRDRLAGALTGAFRRRTLDDEALEALESALLEADVGVDATTHLVEDLRARYRRAGPDADPRAVLREALVDLLAPLEKPLVVGAQRPFVIMLAGVNGAGKTTSIGKLAKWLREQGLTVLLAAGDTFRAAAREQLAAWGQRNGVTVIQQQGGDPAAVVFDAIGAAKARNIDVVIADTAGRLPTQAHLMDELRKIRRVTAKAREGAPDAVLLVLDANTGQNGLAQVKAFDAAVGLTGLIVTKLDGTAKGGVLAAIAKQHAKPVQFIGVGEGMDDLRPFTARDFVEALLPDETPA
jgi:fused signal recognition particle receptor